MQRSALCRSRRAPSHAYLLAKFDLDAAENEPCQVCPTEQCSEGDTGETDATEADARCPEVSEDDLVTAMTPWTETGCLEENGGCSVYGLRCGTLRWH